MTNVLDRMVQQGLLEPQSRERVRELSEEGKTLDEALATAGGVPEEKLLRHLAAELRIPYVDLDDHVADKSLLAQFPTRALLEHHLLPLKEQDGAVVVASSRVFDTTGLDELRLASGKDCRLALAPVAEIDRCLKRCLGVGADTVESLVSSAPGQAIQILDEDGDDSVDLASAAEDASIIKFVNQVLTEAIGLRATDVHVEPFEDELRVRYRVDGMLQEAAIPPDVRRFQAAIVSRLKILSHLDIAEKRLPQDGRIKLRIAAREIDVRVSVIPMLHGEAVVLRLLDRSSALLGLEELGMSAADCDAFERILALPHGIVLVTGPTGSGKTTTLYAALSRINDVERKIVTIEDPIEYHLRGINQIQVSGKAGLTFARGLRSILRQDPDVILVGEIRDRETAEIAVQASLTGHLVFSTLHTNDAAGAITRLVDMGVEPYLVASTLEAVVAQRLVRLICPECRAPVITTELQGARVPARLKKLDQLYAGRGCRQCQGTGYRYRSGIFELMIVTEAMGQTILRGASAKEIRHVAGSEGMKGLREDGWRVAFDGRTTIEEIMRVTTDEPNADDLAASGLSVGTDGPTPDVRP